MISIEAYQIVQEDDGTYTAYLNFINNGKVVKQKSVNATTKAEFKTKIQKFKTQIEDMEAEKNNLLAIVQEPIDEIMGV